MRLIKPFLAVCLIFAASMALGADEAAVRVEPSNLQGPRTLQQQTQTAVIRDYLEAWQSFQAALEQNRAGLLDADFVGTAKDKLTSTIQEQAKLGIHIRYEDRAHDVKIIFYSPDGLSVQLIDKVDYDVQVVDHDKVQASEPVSARYIVVLTPSEVRWRVRVFQAARD